MPIDVIDRVSSRTATAAGHAYATAYGYAAGNNGSGNTTPLISSLTQSGENFTYTYDDVGNIASVVQNNKTTAYTYDALGQLIRVDDENDTTSGTAGTTWTYEYDRGGNILEKKRYAYTTGTLGTALETVTYTYDTTWKDKLINYNGITIEYDAIGNPTKAGTKTGEVWGSDTWYFTWEKGRQLKQMSKTGATAAFKYNSEGLRVQKTVNNVVTNYTLHGKNIVHMTQGSNTLHFLYAPRFSLAGSAGFGQQSKGLHALSFASLSAVTTPRTARPLWNGTTASLPRNMLTFKIYRVILSESLTAAELRW